ncbi:MAG: hypothetical protein N2316_10725 [Spirochaetes bacterium]|nr:hypothetical protein [Spirochaetota bacterium]
MDATIQKVPVSLAQELIKIIRLVALAGKSAFTTYIFEPLTKNGWRPIHTNQNSKKMIERTSSESRDPAYFHTIAPKCKRIVLIAMGETLSALGDACIFFLEMMQIHTKISASPESIEFVKILEPGLRHYQTSLSQKNEVKFKEALHNALSQSPKTALEPIKLDLYKQKVKLDSQIQMLYNNLLIASRYNNIPKARKLLANYIISFIDDESYARDDVNRLIDALNKRSEGFEQELKNAIAIELYYRISKAIVAGDLSAAIHAIRKYAYIFEGNPQTKYYYEIDRLERILYPMISEKKLWDSLKK